MGKTHMKPDANGLARLALDPEEGIGLAMAECGFVAGERDDGLHSEGPGGFYQAREPRYNEYLRSLGMGDRNPWLEWANSGEDESGRVVNGFYMENAHRAARVPAEHSEAAYMTSRAMQTITDAGDKPWRVHLSYIKPHWPLIAPAPYHQMYGADDVPPALRSEAERDKPHPIFDQRVVQAPLLLQKSGQSADLVVATRPRRHSR